MRCTRLLLLFIILVSYQELSARDSSSVDNNSTIPTEFFTPGDSKIYSIDENLTKKTNKILAGMMKQELKLKDKLSKVDSIASNSLLTDGIHKYDEFERRLSQKGEKL
ncbi:MAG TPA: hypothetical protein VGQ04_07840 [Chitinophagaceae bacterium]|jgi:hypothetical protein|nr:hypothetical protein [Chitinophagaceae bacterium]